MWQIDRDCRGRDDYVMRTPAPSLEDICTERIFSAFTKNFQAVIREHSDDVSHSTGKT